MKSMYQLHVSSEIRELLAVSTLRNECRNAAPVYKLSQNMYIFRKIMISYLINKISSKNSTFDHHRAGGGRFLHTNS